MLFADMPLDSISSWAQLSFFVVTSLAGVVWCVAKLFQTMQTNYWVLIDRLQAETVRLQKQNADQQAQLTATKEKTDALWELQIARAKVELTNLAKAGNTMPVAVPIVGTQCDLPILETLPRVVITKIATIAGKLKMTYAMLPPGTSDIDAMQAIEREYRPWLIEQLCLPHNLKDMSCLLIALEVAKGAKIPNGDRPVV